MVLPRVMRRSGRCVVRTLNEVRVAASRTAYLVAHPGVALHRERRPPSSPRLKGGRMYGRQRSWQSSAYSPYSPISPARRLYAKQASYFGTARPERLEDVLLLEAESVEPPTWVTAMSAAVSAVAVFATSRAVATVAATAASRFAGGLFVGLVGLVAAWVVLATFAPYAVGLDHGPLDFVLDKVLAARGDPDLETLEDDDPSDDGRLGEGDAALVVGEVVEEEDLPSPKGTLAQLGSAEEAATSRDAARRCSVLGDGDDESKETRKDPFLHVLSFHLEGVEAREVFDLYWGGSEKADAFYADFLNQRCKNKKAKASTWESSPTAQPIRSVSTLHPLASQIRFPGLNLVVPTTKSQRAFRYGDDLGHVAENAGSIPALDSDTRLCVFERSRFNDIPFADALRVETVWLFKDPPVMSPASTLRDGDTLSVDSSSVPCSADDLARFATDVPRPRKATLVHVYFRTLFLDKVIYVPRWIQRAASAKTKVELATTVSRWRDMALDKRAASVSLSLTDDEHPSLETTTANERAPFEGVDPTLAQVAEKISPAVSSTAAESRVGPAPRSRTSPPRSRHRSHADKGHGSTKGGHHKKAAKSNGHRSSRKVRDRPPPPPRDSPPNKPHDLTPFNNLFCLQTPPKGRDGHCLKTAGFEPADSDGLDDAVSDHSTASDPPAKPTRKKFLEFLAGTSSGGGGHHHDSEHLPAAGGGADAPDSVTNDRDAPAPLLRHRFPDDDHLAHNRPHHRPDTAVPNAAPAENTNPASCPRPIILPGPGRVACET